MTPLCECGQSGCYPSELPAEAWEVAGSAGIGMGLRGTDLLACAPGHVPHGCDVLEDHETWTTCGLAV